MEIKLKKVHTSKDVTLSVITVAVGIGLFFLNTGLGAFIAACGILMLLFWKGGYKRVGDNTLLQKKAFDVSHACRESLKGFLEGKDVEPQLNTTNEGGIIRLEAYYNAAASLAYAQLFDFSNYTYEPSTELVELRGSRADKLIEKL